MKNSEFKTSLTSALRKNTKMSDSGIAKNMPGFYSQFLNSGMTFEQFTSAAIATINNRLGK